tara:strand:+ start:1918 stop:2325 length:408 start_codon:yes stop_codon:yes gene_type:complete
MGTMQQIGNFQASVGRASADLSVTLSYIFGGIMIIAAIILGILAFVPMKPIDCNEKFMCNPPFDKDSSCKNEKKRCNTKTQHHFLLFFLFLIPLAIIMIMVSKAWHNAVHTNRTMAQIGGTMAEVDMVENIFQRN